jgi:hypothetical protein
MQTFVYLKESSKQATYVRTSTTLVYIHENDLQANLCRASQSEP